MKLRYFLFCILTLIFVIGCAQQQEEQIATQEKKTEAKKTYEVVNMKLTSSEFEDNGAIPSQFTCDGADVSPPLTISEVPENTKSLVLVMDDPDAPVGVWDHWVVFNIPPETKEISGGTDPEGILGGNSWGKTGYGGPCPPSGTHRYFFRLYALDTEFDLPEGSTKKELERAMKGHILADAQLIGKYQRQ